MGLTSTSTWLSHIHYDSPETWQGRRFITIDVDWAPDFMLELTAQLLQEMRVSATWFATHQSPFLQELSRDPRHEVGIHPNFNKMLEGLEQQNAKAIVDSLMDAYPSAHCVRSHSMTQSSRLLDIFSSAGLTHDSNHFIPWEAGILLKPWRHWNGMTRVPYFWEDDIACIGGGKLPPESASLCVFDFHPVHLYLNTHCLPDYEKAKGHFYVEEKIRPLINKMKMGARDWFKEIVKS